MSVWNDQRIGDWTPTQLQKFIQQAIFTDPPPLPPSITLDSLSVIGDTEIGGQLSVASLTRLLGNTLLSLPAGIGTRGANQFVTNSTNELLVLGSQLYETDTIAVDLVPSQLRVTEPGLYLVGAQVRWDSNATGLRRLAVLKNSGSSIAGDERSAVSGQMRQSCATLALLDKGDTVEGSVLQNSGAGLALIGGNSDSPFLWAIRLGAGE